MYDVYRSTQKMVRLYGYLEWANHSGWIHQQ